MGHRFEAAADSSVRNVGKDEMKEKLKLIAPSNTQEISDHHNDQRENEVLEFVNLLENSESSGAMKALLLKILKSNKSEELKLFLKDSSTDINRSKKKLGKANKDSNGYDDRHKKNSSRRSSRSLHSELSEQNTGPAHSGTRKSTRTRTSELSELNTGSAHGTRKSTRTRTSELSELNTGSAHGTRKSTRTRASELSELNTGSRHGKRKSTRTRVIDQGSKTNIVQQSPSSSLRRSRQSDSKSNRDAVMSPNQKSKLTSSSSLLQLQMTRRSDLNKRRPTVNLNQGEMQAEKQNANWNPVTPPTTMGKRRTRSTGSFLKPVPFSPKSQNVNQNASWGSVQSPAKSVGSADKLRHKALGKISEKRFGLGNKKKNLGDYSGGDEDRSANLMHDSTLLNSFAQFEPTGQVAYREQTVRLHDLVDGRRPIKDAISSNVEAKEENDETIPGKKGLRKYITKQLTKKKNINRDKQSMASESAHETYRSLSDEKQFHVRDLNDSVKSSPLHSSFAS